MEKTKENKSKKLLYDRIKLYFKEGIEVHVILVETRRFYNGKIIEIRNNYFILEDRKIGKFPILFREVYKVEKLKTNPQ